MSFSHGPSVHICNINIIIFFLFCVTSKPKTDLILSFIKATLLCLSHSAYLYIAESVINLFTYSMLISSEKCLLTLMVPKWVQRRWLMTRGFYYDVWKPYLKVILLKLWCFIISGAFEQIRVAAFT